ALETLVIRGSDHETLSILIMKALNEDLGGLLETGIRIFTNTYPKPFLHQLVSGQLDMDRMDYLTRDSFFTGVSEGVIGYDRILKMLTVSNDELMVEEKAVYSIEKFLVARRLMYWQVYLHKTVLCAEKMLVRILERARELIDSGKAVASGSPVLDLFLQQEDGGISLDKFCLLDDVDVMSAIKQWTFHPDTVLSVLSRGLIDRSLLKVRLQATGFDEGLVIELREEVARRLGISMEDARYFVFTGAAVNTTYDPEDERINILFKDGSVRDISQVDNALIHQTLASTVKKFYLCHLNI
ncbi:MAG TPA: hypothetical protein VNU70_06225, partial [Puia sp.]|nr:hypothetical protein [Puia sp.]